MKWLSKPIHWMVSRKSSPLAYVIALTLIVIAGSILVPIWYKHRCEDRVIQAKATLDILRRGIRFWSREYGAYPISLAEFRMIMAGGNPENLDGICVNLSGDREKVVAEYRELNGRGGYFYDPNAGEIRLNLTRPLKEYFLFYSGRFAEEIPATW